MKKLFLLGAFTLSSLYTLGSDSSQSRNIHDFSDTSSINSKKPHPLVLLLECSNTPLLTTPLTRTTTPLTATLLTQRTTGSSFSVQDYVRECSSQSDYVLSDPSSPPIHDDEAVASPARLLAPYFQACKQQLPIDEIKTRSLIHAQEVHDRVKISTKQQQEITYLIEHKKRPNDSSLCLKTIKALNLPCANNPTKKQLTARKKQIELLLRNGFLSKTQQALLVCPITGKLFHYDPIDLEYHPNALYDYHPTDIEWISHPKNDSYIYASGSK